MVERPIKKSERQAQPNPDAAPQSTESSSAPQSSESGSAPQSLEPKSPPPKPVRRSPDAKSSEESDRGGRRTDRASGRGRKGDKEEPRQAMNPALMRGPKPVQPKPAPEPQPEEAAEDSQEEVTSEESQEETAEA